jgi:hypothetical protein
MSVSAENLNVAVWSLLGHVCIISQNIAYEKKLGVSTPFYIKD